MLRSSNTSQEDSNCVLLAKMDNIHNLVTVLKAIQFKEVRTYMHRYTVHVIVIS